jgi:hypothetical protein
MPKAEILDTGRMIATRYGGYEQLAFVNGYGAMSVVTGRQLPIGTKGTAEYRCGANYGLWFFKSEEQ